MASQHVPMGMNRTGVQMSAIDSARMRAGFPASPVAPPPGDASAMAEWRSQFDREAESLGSVALPGTIKGAALTGISLLSGDKPQLLLDKLGERLAFERTGTRLYDALLAKLQSVGESDSLSLTLAEVRRMRDDEARHFALLCRAIESLGGDPTSETPCADVAGVESAGLIQVITDPRTTLAHSLHALLVAELTDSAGWEMLIDLTDRHGPRKLVAEFRDALEQETLHHRKILCWLKESVG